MENKQKPKVVISPNLKRESVVIDIKTGKILSKKIDGKIVPVKKEENEEIEINQ